MSFQKSIKKQRRIFWRTVFIWIIGLTIPCYILAFFALALNAPDASPIVRTTVPTITWTPVDPYAILTQTALSNPAATQITVVPTNTPFNNFNTTVPDFATVDFSTATTVPTRFITLTPSSTPQATFTIPPTIAQPTAIPTDAPPILVPASDTPNP